MKNLYITMFNDGRGFMCNLVAGDQPPTFQYNQPIQLFPMFTVPDAKVRQILGLGQPQTLVVSDPPAKTREEELASIISGAKYLAETFGNPEDKELINNLIEKAKL